MYINSHYPFHTNENVNYSEKEGKQAWADLCQATEKLGLSSINKNIEDVFHLPKNWCCPPVAKEFRSFFYLKKILWLTSVYPKIDIDICVRENSFEHFGNFWEFIRESVYSIYSVPIPICQIVPNIFSPHLAPYSLGWIMDTLYKD